MQQFDYDEVLDLLLAKDDRYPRAAYHFVREGLDYTQHKMSKMSGAKEPRHVSGQELTGPRLHPAQDVQNVRREGTSAR